MLRTPLDGVETEHMGLEFTLVVESIPKSILHPWHGLYSGLVEDSSHQEGSEMVAGGVLREGVRDGWARQVHRRDAWENNSGHVPD